MNSKSLIEVGVSMVLRDRFSQEAGRISSSFNSMMNDMNAWNRGIRSSTGTVVEWGTKLLGGMGQIYKYSADVQGEIWRASKIAGASTAQQAEMLDLAKKINAETPLTAAQVSSASRYLAMAGNKVDAIKKMLPPISELSSILGVEVGGKGGLADMMTNVAATFNIPMNNMSQMSDDLYTAVTNANISMQDLMASIRYSGADMVAAGQDLRQVSAAVGVLGDKGIQASMAGTSLGNMIRNLQLSLSQQKAQGASWLDELGLSTKDFYDARGNLVDLHTIFQKFAKSYKTLNSMGKVQAFYNIFGVRGMRGIVPILEDMASGRDKMGYILGQYDKNRGIVSQLNEEYMNTSAGLIQGWTSRVENLMVTAGGALARIFNPVLKIGNFLVQIVDKVSNTWAGKFAIQVFTTSTVVATIVAAFRTLGSLVRMVGSYQSRATTAANAMTAATTRTNQGFAVMELHLINIANQLRSILTLQMYATGTYMKADGTLAKSKGKGKRLPQNPFPWAEVMLNVAAAGAAGGATGRSLVGGGSMLAGGRSGVARTFIKLFGKGGAKFALSGLTRFMGFLGNPIGTGISIVLPLILSALNDNTSATRENTNSNNQKLDDPQSIKARNEERFIQAVQLAIKEGMRGSNINISVDGVSQGGYTPGTQRDYTGVALGL